MQGVLNKANHDEFRILGVGATEEGAVVLGTLYSRM